MIKLNFNNNPNENIFYSWSYAILQVLQLKSWNENELKTKKALANCETE
jgi:hypothetical protein